MTTSSSRPPLEELLDALRTTLGSLTPEPLLNRMRPVLEGFFERFQLVPQRDFQAHLANLARLEQQVSILEQRILALEAKSREVSTAPPGGREARPGNAAERPEDS